LREGLYKVEFHTVHGTGNGVIYATSGKLRGGNSGFAFTGSYTDKGDEILAKVSTERHNYDPGFKPLFGTDMITLTLKGTASGDMVDFEGTALQLARRRLQGGADTDRRLIKLEHDPEKHALGPRPDGWEPVFPRDKREAFARRSCSNKKIRS